MVVRWRLGTVLVNVGEDVKIGFLVVIQRVDAALCVGSAISCDECLVGQQFFQVLSDLLAPVVALIGLKDVAGLAAELLKGIGHVVAPDYPIALYSGSPAG